jgi:hypothetical protein
MHDNSAFAYYYETFSASEGIHNVLFDPVDEIVPVHVVERVKARALGLNEKRNGPKEKSSPPQIFSKRATAFVQIEAEKAS